LDLIGGFAFYSVLASQISGVSVSDRWTFSVVAAVVLSIGFASCLLPTRQATRADPLAALSCNN
jgi:ABC-type antimicrobial peptide transport system permease subunit